MPRLRRFSLSGRRLRRSLRANKVDALDEAGKGNHTEQMAQIEEPRRQVAGLEARLEEATDRTLAAIRELEVRDRHDIFAAGERSAVAASARFAIEHMPTAPTFGHPHETLRH